MPFIPIPVPAHIWVLKHLKMSYGYTSQRWTTIGNNKLAQMKRKCSGK